MNRRGFTVIELLIIITIMGILMVVGVVNLRGTQANGRDTERKTDIESIALHLESFYSTGRDDSTIIGRYPSTAMFDGTSSTFQTYLRDVNLKSLAPPGVDVTNVATSFMKATNNAQVATDVTTPQPITISTYVYQPLQNDGTLCTTETQYCRKFNLYYKLEVATAECPAPNNLCMVTSKNQ